MNTTTQPKTREEWNQYIERFEKCELTQTEFCKQNGLILCRFGYYLKQYRNEHKKSEITPSFSQVVLNSQQSTQSTDIKIELPNGFRCQIPNSTQPEQLKKILGAILSC